MHLPTSIEYKQNIQTDVTRFKLMTDYDLIDKLNDDNDELP